MHNSWNKHQTVKDWMTEAIARDIPDLDFSKFSVRLFTSVDNFPCNQSNSFLGVEAFATEIG